MPAPALLSLPPETLDAVCAELDQPDLQALALAARALLPAAARRLYRHIALPTPHAARTALETLAANPALALSVRSFDLAAVPDDADPVLVATAIQNMRAAVSLAVQSPGRAFELLRSDFEHAEYTQLRSLVCNAPLDAHVACFLARCPALTTLHLAPELAVADQPASLPPTVVPNLATLAGAADAARLLLPGRPVHSVQLLSPDALDAATVDALAQSLVPLTCVDAIMADFSLSQLARVASQLGASVENLRITVQNAFAQAPDAAFLAPVADILDTFADLWSFELSGIHWASSVKPDAEGHTKRAWQREPLQLAPDGPLDGEPHGDSLDNDGWGLDVLS